MTGMFGKTALAALLGTLVLAAPANAMADGRWARHHPARHQINHRIAHQQHRITHERREGELTRGQARALRANDRAIRRQEVAMARADHNHGHLTRAQTHQLNRELNANGRAIGH